LMKRSGAHTGRVGFPGRNVMIRSGSRVSFTILLAAVIAAASATFAVAPIKAAPAATPARAPARAKEDIAIFAGGCFWCMETDFQERPGVKAVISGYTGGPEPDPTYEEVSSYMTHHRESVEIHFDPAVV